MSAHVLKNGMLITPSGIPYERMTENMIVYVDGNGKYEEGKIAFQRVAFPYGSLSNADPMPTRLFTIMPFSCTAVSILNRPISAIIHYMIAAAGGNSIPCAPYATFDTRELSEHVALAQKHREATLLQHHGLIACEVNLKKALWLAHEVEGAGATLPDDPGDYGPGASAER
ncbi:class II aldolase/adducin family protein [Escherichia coli]|nr:class II aldolase/adducin family protein [Escherichia coli]